MNTTNQNLNGDDHTPEELAAAKITAYALGQLHGDERAAMERQLVGEEGRAPSQEINEIQTVTKAMVAALASESLPERSALLRDAIQNRLSVPSSKNTPVQKVENAKPSKFWRWPTLLEWCVIGGVCCVLVSLLLPAVQSARESSRRIVQTSRQGGFDGTYPAVEWSSAAASAERASGESNVWRDGYVRAPALPMPPAPAADPSLQAGQPTFGRRVGGVDLEDSVALQMQVTPRIIIQGEATERLEIEVPEGNTAVGSKIQQPLPGLQQPGEGSGAIPGGMPAGGEGGYGGIAFGGKVGTSNEKRDAKAVADEKELFIRQYQQLQTVNKRMLERGEQGQNAEQYAPIYENQFLSPLNQPLSTFSIDVDTASYANTRRFLTSGRLPPRNAVRIEELVNYFRYDYPQPKNDRPFSVNMEVAECPWREGHLVLRVGLKGKDIERAKRPASNLVFLLDVSGSMSDENKLPLLKTAMKLLVNELGENDRVSIVTYAGDAGLKLPSARGHEQRKINTVIDSLNAGGSTNGSAGIELAYEQATAHFITGGANRVILCTDGDLNVGITSDEALVRLIKDKAKSGVFLTVLGFGEGNLKDAKMERLADNGNGLYAYIDSVREAKKVLVEQLTGSTITIAKDVKIQIEFNPAQIAAYRLLGYENRVLSAQDFNNDKKDAGEIGAGHTITALYELVPVGAIKKQEQPHQSGVDPLKYQGASNGTQRTSSAVGGFGGGGFGGGEGGGMPGGFGGGFGGGTLAASGRRQPPGNSELADAAKSGELLTLKLRYKEPTADTSQLLEFPLQDRGGSFNSASPDFQFAASVASFGMVLRQSQFRGSSNLAAVEEIASGSLGTDAGGYRAEFVDLIRKAQALGAR